MPRKQPQIAHENSGTASFRALRMLRAIRAFEKRHLRFLESFMDRELVCEIGYHQGARQPLTLKQIYLLDLGSVSTVQRRLRHLRESGAVCQQRSSADRRVIELRLSAQLLDVFTNFGKLFSSGARTTAK